MFCEVQLLYSYGRQVHEPRRLVQGELTLHKWRDGSNRGAVRLRADLMGADREQAASPLVDAMVVRITESGIVLLGTEVVARNPASSKSNVEYYRQTWWCRLLPGKLELLPPKPPEKPRWRAAFEHPA